MVDNKICFHLLQEFKQVRSQFSSTMLMEHVLLALIHLLNEHRCVPDVIVIHVGESDFSQEYNKQQRCNVVEMTARVKKNTKISGYTFSGLHGSLLLPHGFTALVFGLD